jgi:hypothetical protein
MEGVGRAPAMRRRVGERFDDLVELDDGSGPAVGDQQREGVVLRGSLMDEMDVQAVDFGGEMVEPV